MSASARAKGNYSIRPRPQDIDRYVGLKLRQRRLMLGITQQQMAELIGVTFQQAHKYENGINRIASGRLLAIARALGVGVGYFFEDFDAEASALQPTPKQRLLLDLSRNFISITDRRQQEAICSLARALLASERCGDLKLESPALPSKPQSASV
jgi:transcriptional regulator with XRE-family HTH domain